MIKRAESADIAAVLAITEKTITEIYPHYYPMGAVRFFLRHHGISEIARDIERGAVYLCADIDGRVSGTVTVNDREISRLFVLPERQKQGFGREMLDFAEELIARSSPEVRLDSSLPAKQIYLKRGYEIAEFHALPTGDGDYLCYDVMIKRIEGDRK